MPKDFILYALFGGHFCCLYFVTFSKQQKNGEKMLRNFRNLRNLFSFRGVINSDTPKRVSRFVTPLARGVAFCDPLRKK